MAAVLVTSKTRSGPPARAGEHHLRRGPAWRAAGPSSGRSLEAAFPAALQRAAAEFLMELQARTSSADALLLSRAAAESPAPRAPYALRAATRRTTSCAGCGQRLAVETHSCGVALVALPPPTHGPVQLQGLIAGQAALADSGSLPAIACGAPLPGGCRCAAMVVDAATATTWEPDPQLGGGRMAVSHLPRALA